MKLLSRIAGIILQILGLSPGEMGRPLEEAGRIFGCVYDVQEDWFQKEKTPQRPSAGTFRCGNFRSPTIWRVSTTLTNVNHLQVSTGANLPVLSNR